MDYFLRAPDEQALHAALESAGVAVLLPAHTESVPARIETIWEPVADAEIIADAIAASEALDCEIVEVGGETYSVMDSVSSLAAAEVYRKAGEQETRPAYEREVPASLVAVPGYALDIIGPISKRIGGTDEAPIMQQIDGFHANLRGELTQEQMALLPVIAEPAAPVRVWF